MQSWEKHRITTMDPLPHTHTPIQNRGKQEIYRTLCPIAKSIKANVESSLTRMQGLKVSLHSSKLQPLSSCFYLLHHSFLMLWFFKIVYSITVVSIFFSFAPSTQPTLLSHSQFPLHLHYSFFFVKGNPYFLMYSFLTLLPPCRNFRIQSPLVILYWLCPFQFKLVVQYSCQFNFF